jgi:hypothetical protein
MKTYIYILQDPITLSVRYVGKSNNVKKRFYQHISNNKKTTYVNSWIKSLKIKSLKPIISIIDETEDDWEQLEIYWISQFKTWGFELCNHTKGGQGSYGGGKWNNVPVSSYTKEGVFIKAFNSQKECASYFNTSSCNVKNVVNGKNILLLKKYQIKKGYNDNNIEKSKKRKERIDKNKERLNNKKVKCIQDNLIFSSQKAAAKYYKKSISTINNIINGKTKQTRDGKSFSFL